MLTKEEELDLYIRMISEDADADICRHILNLNAEIENQKNDAETQPHSEMHSKYRKERYQ